MTKNIQIGADVSDDLRNRLLDYSRDLHLSESALINLLIARELKLRRLSKLPPYQAVKRTVSRTRLTGRQSKPNLKAEFEAHVNRLAIDRADAIVSLAEAELRERWLQKALGWMVESN